jgi:transmembrane sensor
MKEDQFWLLASLKLSGEATEEELAELDALLQLHPDMGFRLDILRNIWLNEHPGSSRKGDALNKHLQRLSNHLSEPVLKYETEAAGDELLLPERSGRSRNYRWLWAVSGVAASVMTFFLFFYEGGHKKPDQTAARNTVSTKLGSKSKIQLPDGSQVWLNADSRITYDESFYGASREVQLAGEAYFDVVKDKNHPFIIHASSIDIKVLGTTLNVRAYTNEKNTEAALIRESVEISLRSDPDKKIILQPNEKLVVHNNKLAVITGKAKAESQEEKEEDPKMVLDKVHFQKRDSVATEILWVKNKLAFDQESLENVALKIERWYNVKVSITQESLKSVEYSGVFEDESLKQVMEALRLTGNFRYTINKKEVIIRP